MLLDERMLPRLKREVPQLKDVLETEDKYLDLILDELMALEGRTLLLKEEVMNAPNLETKVKQIMGWDCKIIEDPEHLTITVRCIYEGKDPTDKQVQQFFMYVPAHLKILMEYLQEFTGAARAGVGMGALNRIQYTAYPTGG